MIAGDPRSFEVFQASLVWGARWTGWQPRDCRPDRGRRNRAIVHRLMVETCPAGEHNLLQTALDRQHSFDDGTYSHSFPGT